MNTTMSKRASLLSLAVGLCALLVLAATPAFADYAQVGAFAGGGPGPGGSGSADGQLSNPGQADVLTSTGAIYIADTGNNRIQVFTPSGTSAGYSAQAAIPSPTGLAIDQSDGSVYVATSTGIAKLQSSLATAAGWANPGITGSLTLAVDPTTHDLLVADRDAGAIRRYHSDGTPAGSFPAARPLDLDIDSTGDVVVVTSTGDIINDCSADSAVERFSSGGVSESTITSLDTPGAIAVDADGDTLLVATKVDRYNCGVITFSGQDPELSVLTPAGTLVTTVVIGVRPADPLADLDTRFATVPGLAVAGGGSRVAYYITKSPFNNIFGGTKATVVKDLMPPIVTVGAATAISPTGASIAGAVNPHTLPTTAHFEYRRKGLGAAWTPLADQDAGSGSSPVAITDQLTSLTPSRTYQFRVAATNEDQTVTSEVHELVTTSAAPVAQTSAVADLTATGARLRGTVDPRGGLTTYFFEYGPTAAYGSQIPLSPATVDPSASGAVSQHVTGLRPDTTYHVRIVASSAAGTSHGDDRVFTTPAVEPAARAYEQVSASQKNFADVVIKYGGQPESWVTFASPDGTRVGYQADSAFGDSGAGAIRTNYLARRTATGWVTTSFAVKGQGRNGTGWLLGWSSDLSSGVYYATASTPPLAPGQTPNATNLLRVDTATKSFVTATPDLGLNEPGGDPTYVGGSTDQSTVVYRDTWARHAPGAPAAVQSLYAWHADHPGTVDLVSTLPDPDGSGPLTAQPAADGAELAGVTSFGAFDAISSDGSRIFFQTPDGRLYVRVDGSRTVEVAASRKATPDAAQPAQFGAASADGNRVFFTTAEQLLDDDVDTDSDLYRYDVTTGQLTRIVRGVATVYGSGDDGSSVYYAGPEGLGLWHDGAIRDVDLGSAVVMFGNGTFGGGGASGVRVAADGTGIVMNSSVGILYYNADDDELRCASCRDDGGAMASGDTTTPRLPLATSASGGDPLVGIQRSITADGDRVFFSSADPLVAGDTNGTFDAYEFHDGRPHLLSSGRDASRSYFVDASADGTDAFIVTKERLASSDVDATYDVYDARVGGGFPDAPVRPVCVDDGCQGAALPGASPPVIGSVSFDGAGDAAAPGRPAPAKLSIARAVKGAAATLRVKVPGKGRIVASGPAVRTASRTATKANTYSLALRLSAKARRTLAKAKTLKTTVKVVFTPATGRPVTASVTLSFTEPKAAQRRATARHTTAKAGR